MTSALAEGHRDQSPGLPLTALGSCTPRQVPLEMDVHLSSKGLVLNRRSRSTMSLGVTTPLGQVVSVAVVTVHGVCSSSLHLSRPPRQHRPALAAIRLFSVSVSSFCFTRLFVLCCGSHIWVRSHAVFLGLA